MKFYQFIIIIGLFNFLSSCSSDLPPPHYKMVNPTNVSLFTGNVAPSQGYTIIGTAIVSRKNIAGIKRQKAIINDHLREIAAQMGGDAIIKLSSTPEKVSGLVVAYEAKHIS